MKFKYIFSFLFVLGLLVSCNPYDTMEDPEIDSTPVGKMLAGEWWVTYTVDGVDIYNMGYTKITTSNTSDNDATQMLITDHKNFWWYNGQLSCNVDNNTFSGTDIENGYYEMTFNITNGKVIAGGGVTEEGNVTDSIYMEIEYSDDPGTIYVASGVRRTGFLEDEYE